MATEPVLDILDQQTWLDPISDAVQKAIENAYAASGTTGQQVKNILSGTWLGHPVHPAVTDVPVGSWSAAFVFDVLEAASGNRAWATAADAAQAIGLGGAVLAAISGLNDWHFAVDRPRRLGMAHALLNTTAAGIYGVSSVLRLTGARPWGRRLSYLGLAIATFSAWIGGDLVFGERLGVDHASEMAPEDFTPVLDESALREGQPQRVDAGGVPVMLVRENGSIYALGEICSHLGGPLSEGQCAHGVVTCPWHTSQFALDDGHVINGPATFPQPAYQTRVRNGKIEVGPRIAKAAPNALTGPADTRTPATSGSASA